MKTEELAEKITQQVEAIAQAIEGDPAHPGGRAILVEVTIAAITILDLWAIDRGLIKAPDA